MRLLRKPSHSLAMSAFGVSCVRGERDIVTIVANTIPASTISKFPCYLVGPSTCLHDTLDLTCCLLSLTAHRRYEPEGPEPAGQLQVTVSLPPPAIVTPQLNTTRECSNASAVVVPLLQSFPSIKAPSRMWRHLLTISTRCWDLTWPFAAIPENGREIDGLDDKSEVAHRIMPVNLLRLLGVIKTKKATRQIVTRPMQVVLPLSPNHGLFGNDGLYAESKVSLETLSNRWSSESWGEYLCLVGAVIG